MNHTMSEANAIIQEALERMKDAGLIGIIIIGVEDDHYTAFPGGVATGPNGEVYKWMDDLVRKLHDSANRNNARLN